MENLYLKEKIDEDLSLYLGKSHIKGEGVFVGRSYSQGENILTFGGPTFQRKDIHNHGLFLQIDHNLYLGPSNAIDDYANHSCDPNCGLKEDNGGIHLCALREITMGEEITFVYSTSMGDGLGDMWCSCGSVHCRGKITDFELLPPLLQQKYIQKGIVLRYLISS